MKAIFLYIFGVVVVLGQQCTLQDNTDYDNGFLVQLYGVGSAQDCCTACGTFAECTYFSWVKGITKRLRHPPSSPSSSP